MAQIINGTNPYLSSNARASLRVCILFILKFYPERIFQQHAFLVIRFNFHHSGHFPASSSLIYRINSSVPWNSLQQFFQPLREIEIITRLSVCSSTPDSFSLKGRTSYQCHSSSPAFQLIPHSIPRPCYKLILAMAENFSGVYLVYGRTSIVQHTNQDPSFNPYPGFTLLPFNPRVRRHAG